MKSAKNNLLKEVNNSDTWKHYKKTNPMWAKKLEEAITIQTLEGELTYNKGDYLCKGQSGDIWGQKEESLFKKYEPDPKSKPDKEGWQKFVPKPDASGVMAAQIDHEFTIDHPDWGIFQGNPGDYLVKSFEDKDTEFQEDVWIVKKEIFDTAYEKV
ncbi:MAG: PGDYG domain-containing protein [Candidatus Cloacimonetes bacterium]|nr:PGDYG domain-containing protein [Candidatus Cloacimonadota bacterium]